MIKALARLKEVNMLEVASPLERKIHSILKDIDDEASSGDDDESSLSLSYKYKDFVVKENERVVEYVTLQSTPEEGDEIAKYIAWELKVADIKGWTVKVANRTKWHGTGKKTAWIEAKS